MPSLAAVGRFMRLLLASLAFLAVTSLARAEIRIFDRFGAWEVFWGTDNQGQPTCAVGTTIPGPGSRTVLVQYFIGQDFLHMRLMRIGWAIPHNAEIRVVSIIGRQTWNARAIGEGNRLVWFITGSTMREWEHAFRTGSTMEIHFLTGNEPPWIISLAGSSAALNSMVICIQTLSSMGGNTPPNWSTQPFNIPKSTHPTSPTEHPINRGRRT
jgi:hypothetical protein